MPLSGTARFPSGSTPLRLAPVTDLEAAQQLGRQLDVGDLVQVPVTAANDSPGRSPAPSAWQASHAYTVGQTFTQAGTTYVVSTAYTSGGSFGSTDTSNTFVLGSGSSVSLAEKSAWTTATAYAVGDAVNQNGYRYFAKVAHTSGTFATDKAAGNWTLAGLALDDTAAPAAGTVPVYNSATGKSAAGSPKFDALRSAYNVSPTSLGRFRAQVGKALTSTTPASILCLGDSITQGVSSTPQRLYNWPSQLRALLNASGRLGLVGEGAAFNTGQASGGSKTAYDERWTLGTGWTWSSGGVVNNSMCQGTGGNPTTFALPSCDSVTIYYMRHSIGGTWTYSIDGGAATNVNSNGTLLLTSVTFSVTAGTHTLTITSPASNYALILGVAWSTSSAPLDVNVVTGGGTNGITSSKLTDETNSGYGGLSVIDLLKPDLTIVCMGRNDSNPANGVTVAQYLSNLTGFIQRVRTTNTKDIMLLTPPPASAATYTNDSQIVSTLYTLADTYDCALVDLESRFGSSWNAAPYSLSADNIHPNDAGSRVLAQTVASVLIDACA